MSKQVIPFKSPISLGYMVICDYGDGEIEPEGVVYFDGPPRIGDKAILSDGREYVVTRESNEQMEIRMQPVIEKTISEQIKESEKEDFS